SRTGPVVRGDRRGHRPARGDGQDLAPQSPGHDPRGVEEAKPGERHDAMRMDDREFEKLLQPAATPGPLPPSLADRITAAAVRDFRVQRPIRRAGWATVAGAVLIAGWFAIPSADRRP